LTQAEQDCESGRAGLAEAEANFDCSVQHRARPGCDGAPAEYRHNQAAKPRTTPASTISPCRVAAVLVRHIAASWN
jgi:hypothetical protein